MCVDGEQLLQCLLYDEYSDGTERMGGWEGSYTQPNQSSNAGVSDAYLSTVQFNVTLYELVTF